jgi:hypothetical protein
LKKINIISEAIYKGQIKQVNQGSFVNLTNIVNDIFTCFGIPCCENKADFFIRKTYLLRGRKKPGPNWRSLNELILDVYNCCAGTTLCSSTQEQWWITTDVIRPSKTIETINFTNIIIKVLTCCELLDCCGPVVPPISPFFDVTADWSAMGVTNQSDFENYLTTALGATSVTISSFNLTGNKLEATMVVTGVATLNLAVSDVTAVDKIGGFDNTLTTIDLSFNLLTTFNPVIALPSSLTLIKLYQNQIVTFNPTLPLPAGLIELNLAGNQIVTFNPTLPLPSTLEVLELGGNNIVIFNPTNSLPISLTGFSLDNNQMTTAGYTSSEPWANSQPAFSSNCNINFGSNINSVTGTNLETILLTKNCTIFP